MQRLISFSSNVSMLIAVGLAVDYRVSKPILHQMVDSVSRLRTVDNNTLQQLRVMYNMFILSLLV